MLRAFGVGASFWLIGYPRLPFVYLHLFPGPPSLTTKSQIRCPPDRDHASSFRLNLIDPCEHFTSMATVVAKVQESLLGSEAPSSLSSESKDRFLKYARQDEEDGDFFMHSEDFVNAIAPPEEDYVSCAHQIYSNIW